MKGDYRVTVWQGEMFLEFVFSELCDAMDFAKDCIECGKDGTRIGVQAIEEDI